MAQLAFLYFRSKNLPHSHRTVSNPRNNYLRFYFSKSRRRWNQQIFHPKALGFYKIDDSSSQKKLRPAFVPCVRSCPGHPPHFQGQDGTVREPPCSEVLLSSEFHTNIFLWERMRGDEDRKPHRNISVLPGVGGGGQGSAHGIMDKHWVWVLLSPQVRLKIPPS